MILYLLKYYLESKLFSVLPEKKIRKIHLKRFRKIFEYAKENSEFYAKEYKKAGVFDLHIQSEDDVNKIPFVDKEKMKTYGLKQVLTCDEIENLIVSTTSGSTGKPFEVYTTKSEYFTGYVRTFLGIRGYNPFRPFGLIGISKAKEKIEKKSFLGFVKKYLGLFRREAYTIYTPPAEIISKLRNRKLNILSSTPSCLKVLIDELKKNDEKLSVKTVVVSGETLNDEIRDEINKHLRAKIINFYGCMEHTSLAWTEPNGSLFKYSVNSIMVEYTNPVKINGEWYGELVITNLINKTMPFIRYKTGDHVKIQGLYNRMGKIIGRAEDMIELVNGKKIFMQQLYKFIYIKEYTQYKFVQKKDKSIHFKAVCKPGVDKIKVKEKVLSVWNENFSKYPLEVEFVDKLSMDSKSGKFKRIEVEV